MKSEQVVEKLLCRRVKEHDGMAVKLTGKTGIPDRLIIMPNGKSYFVETKVQGGRVSPIQEATHIKLRSMGHEVAVLWNCEEVEKWICTITKKSV